MASLPHLDIVILWSITLLLQAAMIWHSIARLTRLYPIFLLWMAADLVYQAVMFVIYASPSPVSGDLFTRLWGTLEIGLAIMPVAACYESVRRVRKYQIETILLATVVSAGIAWAVSRALGTPQHFSSSLEPAIRFKAFIDLALFCVIIILVESKPQAPRGAQKYSFALAGYFGAMAAVNFLSVYQMSYLGRARMAQILSAVVPGMFFLVMLIIFWGPPNRAGSLISNAGKVEEN